MISDYKRMEAHVKNVDNTNQGLMSKVQDFKEESHKLKQEKFE